MNSKIELIERILVENGLEPGFSLHSWRCEHPDRYGECDCVHILAEDIADSLEKHDGA